MVAISHNIHGIKEVFIFAKQLKNKREKMKIYFNLVLSEGGFHHHELHSMTVRKNKKKKF